MEISVLKQLVNNAVEFALTGRQGVRWIAKLSLVYNGDGTERRLSKYGTISKQTGENPRKEDRQIFSES